MLVVGLIITFHRGVARCLYRATHVQLSLRIALDPSIHLDLAVDIKLSSVSLLFSLSYGSLPHLNLKLNLLDLLL